MVTGLIQSNAVPIRRTNCSTFIEVNWLLSRRVVLRVKMHAVAPGNAARLQGVGYLKDCPNTKPVWTTLKR